jgi:hypothetical protein
MSRAHRMSLPITRLTLATSAIASHSDIVMRCMDQPSRNAFLTETNLVSRTFMAHQPLARLDGRFG